MILWGIGIEALFEANNDTLFGFVGDQENVDF
jgi:hypothetical protein